MKQLLKLLALLLFIIPVAARAQSNFKPGYVVTPKGDTIRGTVNYREWENNPVEFRFKDAAGQLTNYNLISADAFGVDGIDYYERHVVFISIDETNLSRILGKLDTTMVKDTVFLRVLTKGKNLVLYYYNDKIKFRYLAGDRQSGQINELGHHVYKDSVDVSQFDNYDAFKSQLVRFAYKFNKFTPGLNDSIRHLNYNEDIIKIVNKINGNAIGKITGKTRTGTRLFAGVAFNRATLTYSGDIPLTGATINQPSYFPELNVGIDLFQNASVGRFVFRTELGVTGAKFALTQGGASQKISETMATLSPLLVYHLYNSEKLKFFISSGARICFSAYSERTYTLNLGLSSVTYTDFPQLQKLGVEVPIKAGVTINSKIEIFGCYNLAESITGNTIGFSGDMQTTQIGVHYLFGTK